MRIAKRDLTSGTPRFYAVPSPDEAVAAESKYQLLFDQASDAVLTVVLDGPDAGRIDAANQAMEELSGYLKTELCAGTLALLVPEQALPPHARPLSSELLEMPGTHEDVALLRKDGYVRYVDMSVRLVESQGTRYALALFRDLTEKKRMERELITKHTELRNAYQELERKTAELQAMQETLVQSGKMAALGELSAGIAHELNQPLQGIRGYAQELQSTLFGAPQSGDFAGCPPQVGSWASESERSAGSVKIPAPEAAASLREIVSNADKMASIIGYLRAFVRKSTENYELAQVHTAIEEALKMLGRQLASRGITVEKDFDPELPTVFANPLQLEQVFINLATNARDAIEATGRGCGKISISTRRAGKMVEILFRDDGCGMSERTKARAFNPFYTTKEVGKGMGLGLSLSYGILSKLQGSIVVRSELGKGAEFLVRIPTDFRELA